MLLFGRLMVIILSCICTARINLWRQFKGYDGEKINRTNLALNYKQVCPIRLGRGTLKPDSDTQLISEVCLYNDCSEKLNCHCTKQCCHNSPLGYLGVSQFTPQIYPLNSETLYLMVERCPYDSIDELKKNCESKYLGPVTSTQTGITYKNLFCARCHNDTHVVKWKLKFYCSVKDRWKSQQSRNNKSNCGIRYDLEDQYRNLIQYCTKRVPHLTHLTTPRYISRCNETGMWNDYDRDVEWACLRFNMPYQHFKNIFCYICNPSIVSTQYSKTKPLISSCGSVSSEYHENITHFVTNVNNASVEELCKFSDIVPRLSPFRNAYCFVCYKQIFNKPGRSIKFQSLNIEKKEFLLQASIDTSANKTLIHDSLVNDIKHIIRIFENQTRKRFVIQNRIDKIAFAIERKSLKDKQKLTDKLVEMCSRESLCANTKYTKIYTNCGYCSCGRNCIFHGSCCLNALLTTKPYVCSPESAFPFLKETHLEESSDSFFSYALIDKCFGNNSNLISRQKCEDSEMSDVSTSIPVQIGESIYSFKNLHCLLCNVEAPIKEVKMYFRVKCQDYFEIDILPNMLDIVESIKLSNCKVYVALTKKYGERIKCGMNINRIVQSNQAFVCLGNSTTNGRGDDINKLCKNDDSPIIVDSFSLRHVNCINCNKLFRHIRKTPKVSTVVQCMGKETFEISNEYLCFFEESQPSLENDEQNRNPDVSTYRSLFAVLPSELRTVQQMTNKRCKKGTFDFTKGICSRFFCSGDRVLENGTCVNIFESIVDTSFVTSMVLQVCNTDGTISESDFHNNSNENETQPDIKTLKFVEISTHDVCTSIYDMLEDIIGNSTKMSYIHCSLSAYGCKTGTFHATNNSENKSKFSQMWDITDKTIIHANITVHLDFTNQRSQVERHLFTLKKQTLLQKSQVPLCPRNIKSSPADKRCAHQNISIRDTHLNTTVAQTLIHIKKSLFCPLIEISTSDITYNYTTGKVVFKYLNTTVSVSKDSVNIIKNIKSTQTLRICKNDLRLPTPLYKIVKKTDLIEAYALFSICCNAVSLLSLVFTLLTYMIFKVLRTIPGKNNMNLALCLLLAQASLQYPHYFQGDSKNIQCQVLGICIHYFWLATFFALSVCSFHMFKVFSGQVIVVRDNYADIPRYSLYIYGCPVLVIAATISVNIAIFGSLGYGITRCFIDNFYAVIAAFVLPSCLIFITNIIFYGKTIFMICNCPTIRCNKEERSMFLIYLKLCTITGAAWPLLFIDALLPMSVFSFIATFTNALQGFFIFVSFICNRRVWLLYNEAFFSSNKQDVAVGRTESLSQAKSFKHDIYKT